MRDVEREPCKDCKLLFEEIDNNTSRLLRMLVVAFGAFFFIALGVGYLLGAS